MAAQEVFELFDADADDKLSIEEFGRALRALGNAPTEKEVEELAAGRETISYNEFKSVLSSYTSPKDSSIKQELRESLSVFDRENSGNVPEAELRFVLSNMGEILSDTEVDQIIKDAPKNKDGEIPIESLLKMILSM
eukprot:CAMPEP_0114522810 /NCGR_PEP_ID=MMETSP0109-20121206/20945_1 /TAXON_ID=29199 /ORGANISM="Chlorarachnion reptans, Strain CCCM449" /LENGTH=136 /DNA_ID=CAMNT_0001704061 /DNA_START=71 /DNA_END=481 /DNA_ORIENTATION=-